MISLNYFRPIHSHSEGEPGCPQCESATTTITECGHCGTAVDADAESCPVCDRVEIVQYTI